MNDAAALADRIVKPMDQRAMLVRLSISQWTARKTDRKIADEDATRTGSDRSMHSHSRRLLAKAALEKIDKAVTAAREYHNKNTLPWKYDGVGILSSKSFFDYMQRMRELERDFNNAVAEFLPVYQDHITAAATMLGTTFNQKDYPHPVEIARRFSFSMDFSKVEIGSDFRVPDIGKEAEAEIRAEIDRRTEEAISDVARALWEQIGEHVGHMVTRLKALDERETRQDKSNRTGVFYDSVVENLRDLVERIPRLNLTESSEIAQMRQRLLDQLCKTEPEDLRTMPLTRQDVLSKAEKILADVSEFLA